MELTGTVKVIGETDQVSDKFKKRELVITTNENPTYPQHISVQATQDKVAMFDNLRVGQIVHCSINLRGREWVSPQGVTKYFNTIECWKLIADNDGTAPPQQSSGVVEDGLPF